MAEQKSTYIVLFLDSMAGNAIDSVYYCFIIIFEHFEVNCD